MKILLRDNKYRTQEQAIPYHNERNEIFLSVSDIFYLDESSLKEIPRDWKGMAYQMSSTRIDYEKNTITHHTDSTVIKPTVIKLKNIPVCQPTYLNELLKTTDGLAFARALCGNIKLKKEKIISEFERVTGKKANKIRFWTPSQSSRKDRPIRSVVLYFDGFDGFDVDGSWFDNDNGLSRGVITDSAKQTKFFSNKATFDIEEETITVPMKKTLIKDIEKKQSKKEKVKINWDLKVKL